MKALDHMTEPELAALMRSCADGIKSKLPTGTLFVLVVFDEPGTAQYISNGRREDVIDGMIETAVRLAAKQDVPR